MMRKYLIAGLLLAGTSTPALAQRADPVDRRVDRLEQEMRAVQRRVFPDGRTQFVEPELRLEQQPGGGGRSGDALSGLNARVDAVEAQLRTLTGQVEEQGFRTRQLETQINQLRADMQARAEAQEPARPVTNPPRTNPGRPAAADPVAAPPEEAPPSAAPTAGADAAEEAYNVGYRLWNGSRYQEAQQSLEAAIARYPNSRWLSWMRNLQGRAFLDEGKPATAARIFLANYQESPRGERAADSLYFLGQALNGLNRRTEACRVYSELEQVYPNMRDFLRQRLPQARTDARCTASN